MTWLWLGFLLTAIVIGVTTVILALYADDNGSQRAGWWARTTGITTAVLFLLSIWSGVANLTYG